jgi:mono/diheme cytochrome c family protein
LLILAGHYGGSLTHGRDYLLTSAPAFVQRIAGYAPDTAETVQIEEVQQAAAYKDLAAVILDRKCVSCHGPNKQKGGLRLDAPEWIRKGGEDGSIFVSGNPEGSELIKRILLPRDDEDHMPPREKSQLTREEIAYLHWWIRQGADFNRPVHELAQSDSIRIVLKSFEKNRPQEKKEDLPAEPDREADIALVDSLEKLGLLIMPLAKESRNLEVSFINCTRPPDSVLSLLQGLSAHVISLNMAGKQVTDDGLASVARLTRLRKLYLGHSQVTDQGLGILAGLPDLQYINLTHTKITENGLAALQALPHLGAIYLAGTAINREAWPRLRSQFPNVYLDSGGYRLPLLATDTETVKETKRR